ncbi:hypothetical protein STXM2123_3582 [Streptomyces sp. F-3]|nr:hypothetical protein STXM2123_3582 [Streptomyces sp. F-3]
MRARVLWGDGRYRRDRGPSHAQGRARSGSRSGGRRPPEHAPAASAPGGRHEQRPGLGSFLARPAGPARTQKGPPASR